MSASGRQTVAGQVNLSRDPLVSMDRAPPEGDSEHDCNWGTLILSSNLVVFFFFAQVLSSIYSPVVTQLVARRLCIAVLQLARRMTAAGKQNAHLAWVSVSGLQISFYRFVG